MPDAGLPLSSNAVCAFLLGEGPVLRINKFSSFGFRFFCCSQVCLLVGELVHRRMLMLGLEHTSLRRLKEKIWLNRMVSGG